MREVKLDCLAWRTIFTYQGTKYEKGCSFQARKVKCHPVLGGQVQREIDDWLPLDAMVTVSNQ